MPGNVANCRWVTKKHFWTAGSNVRDKIIKARFGHLEGRHQFRAHKLVADYTNPVLCPQLDRRAPDNYFRIANVNIPPASCSPFGGNIVANALFSDEEN